MALVREVTERVAGQGYLFYSLLFKTAKARSIVSVEVRYELQRACRRGAITEPKRAR